jgi:hypothetical protein
MEGHCSTGQSSQGAVVPMEEEEYMWYTQHNACLKETRTRIIISFITNF